MMESNEISIFMEVKLDMNNDRKPELLRNWTKCLVKIEAIKCFPCYIRITFIRNIEDESANLCVRINIPGLSVRSARSRTKTHSYGLFWKQNRKRCCIFVAFDTQLSCERHMRWMKKSIKNLELHRQELLEAKRNSIGKLTKSSSMSELSKDRLEGNRNLRDLQDILGPLPKIPDFRESGNWSRRVSGNSGIYEEIPSAESDFALNVSQHIQPNFNFSCNISTVNLVGANLNSVENSPNAIVDDLSGYCVMAPIKKDSKLSLDSDKEIEDDTKSNIDQLYEIMNPSGNQSTPVSVDNVDKKRISHIYQNLTPTTPVVNISSDVPDSGDDLKKIYRKSTSIDDKVPSYYPNSDSIKVHRRKSNSVSEKNSIRHLTSVKASHRENLYISSPQKILNQRKQIETDRQRSVKLRACKTSSTLYSVVKTESADGDDDPSENNDHEMNSKNDENSPRIYQKYATLARLSPNKYLEKCAKKTADFGSVKKFASLPRFKKIDFSPLKIKINNVLQRHQSDGL